MTYQTVSEYEEHQREIALMAAATAMAGINTNTGFVGTHPYKQAFRELIQISEKYLKTGDTR